MQKDLLMGWLQIDLTNPSMKQGVLYMLMQIKTPEEIYCMSLRE